MNDMGKKFQQLKKEFYATIKSDYNEFERKSKKITNEIESLVSDVQKLSDQYGFPVRFSANESDFIIKPYDMKSILYSKYGELSDDDLRQATGKSFWISSSYQC